MRGRHFLVLKPDWGMRDDIEHHAAAIAEFLDLAPYDVRHRLLKPGATLLAKDTDPEPLNRASESLLEGGYRTVVVTEEELRKVPRPGRAVKLRQEEGAIEFLDGGDRVILRIDGQSRLLVVLGDLDQRRDAAVHSLLRNEYEDPRCRKEALLKGRVVLRLFDDSGGQGVFIKGTGFQYLSLGEGTGLSMAHNLNLLMDRIVACAAEVVIDADLGLADELPVNARPPVPESEETLVRFELHALVTLAMWRAGLIPASAGAESIPSKGGSAVLPAQTLGTTGTGGVYQTLRFSHRSREAFRKVGPPWFVLLLMGIALAAFVAVRVTGGLAFFGISLVVTGILAVLYGFGSWKRKRTIEDYPTSRIRSLAMGKVEITGTAVPRVPMRSPYGEQDCVYFRYQLQEHTTDHRGRTQWKTVGSGSSEAIPFGIRDDTGEVMVLPQGAQFDLSSRRTIPVSTSGSSGLGLSKIGDKTRAIEECIPSFGTVYVLGTARPIQVMPPDHRRDLAMRLRALKRDKARLARFDTDGDGRIDEDEWKAAVTTVESEILRERVESGPEPTDRALIGAGEPGELFLVSDHSEEKLLRQLTASTWIGWVLGTLLFGGGVWVAVSGHWTGGRQGPRERTVEVDPRGSDRPVDERRGRVFQPLPKR